MKQESPLLEESGIVITRSHLTVPGRTLSWESVDLVRVFGPGNLVSSPGQRRKYQIMVSTRTEPVLVSIFETEDNALMKRVEEAIKQVAEILGARKAYGNWS